MTANIYEALQRGETVEVDGLQLRIHPTRQHGSSLQHGDMYIAKRAGGRLFTVALVHQGPDEENLYAYVQAQQGVYRSALNECIGVEVVGITAAFEVAEQLDF